VEDAGIMTEVIHQPGTTIVEKLEHSDLSKPEIRKVLESEEFHKVKSNGKTCVIFIYHPV
jgi:hypothetical protein